MCRKTNRWSSIALGWLGQDLGFGHFRQLLDDFGAQMIVAQDPDSFGWKDGAQTIDRLLDQRAITTEAEYLFGVRAPAARPETGASAAGQNQAVIVRVAAHPPSGYP